MYFVSFTILILRGGEESKVALSRDLLLLDDCALRQKTETGNRRDISLDTLRILQADSHHLIATANTDHLFTRFMRPDNRHRYPIGPQAL